MRVSLFPKYGSRRYGTISPEPKIWYLGSHWEVCGDGYCLGVRVHVFQRIREAGRGVRDWISAITRRWEEI